LLPGLQERIERANKARQIFELRRMKEAGMLLVDQIALSAKCRLPPEEEAVFARRSKGIVQDYATIVRAVRQLLILEQELTGLRQPRRDPKPKPETAETAKTPARAQRGGSGGMNDNLTEYYDFRPVGEAVGFIRETLGIAAPPDDPFPAAKSKPAEPAAAESPPPASESQAAAPKPASPKPARAIRAPADNSDRDRGRELGQAILHPGRPHRHRPRGPP
jgi:hypothetical protein